MSPLRNRWPHHPGVRSGNQLSIGERAADRLPAGPADAPESAR